MFGTVDVTMISSEYELDLLHLRCSLLRHWVEKFIVVESNITHSGKPKASIYDYYCERPWYGQFDITFMEINQDPNQDSWFRENEQRRACKEALFTETEGKFNWAIISDLDEVPDPELGWELGSTFNISFRPVLWMHYFHLNTPVAEYQRWTKGPMVLTRKDAEHIDYQHARLGNWLEEVEDGGWHWSSCLTSNGVIEKMGSFAHTEYDNREALIKVMHNFFSLKSIHGEDLVIRDFDSTYYPGWLCENKELYPHLTAYGTTDV